MRSHVDTRGRRTFLTFNMIFIVSSLARTRAGDIQEGAGATLTQTHTSYWPSERARVTDTWFVGTDAAVQ